jgi:hypothetical protein
MKCRRWGCWTWSQGSEHNMAWMVGNGELMSIGMDIHVYDTYTSMEDIQAWAY